MGEVGQALDHGMQDLVGAEAGGVLESRLHHEREVPVPSLETRDDIAATERDGEQVGRHLGDVRRGREPIGCGRTELEHPDEAVPEDDRRQDGAVKATSRQEAGGVVRRQRLAGAGRYDHGCAPGHGLGCRWVVAELPGGAVAHGVSTGVARRERCGDPSVDPVHGAGVEALPRAQRSKRGEDERLRIHRRRVHAEPCDEVVELSHPPGEDRRIVIPRQSERRGSRRGFGQSELLPIHGPTRVFAVDLDETDDLLAQGGPGMRTRSSPRSGPGGPDGVPTPGSLPGRG